MHMFRDYICMLQWENYATTIVCLFFLFQAPFMVGAAGSAFLINDATTSLPRAVITRARAYLAGAAADVLEVEIALFKGVVDFIMIMECCLFFYHWHCHLLVYVNQIGVRTEGLQEALQKTAHIEENSDRITKIKRTLKAVSYAYQCINFMLILCHLNYTKFIMYAFPLFVLKADGLEVFAIRSTAGLHLC